MAVKLQKGHELRAAPSSAGAPSVRRRSHGADFVSGGRVRARKICFTKQSQLAVPPRAERLGVCSADSRPGRMVLQIHLLWNGCKLIAGAVSRPASWNPSLPASRWVSAAAREAGLRAVAHGASRGNRWRATFSPSGAKDGFLLSPVSRAGRLVCRIPTACAVGYASGAPDGALCGRQTPGSAPPDRWPTSCGPAGRQAGKLHPGLRSVVATRLEEELDDMWARMNSSAPASPHFSPGA